MMSDEASPEMQSQYQMFQNIVRNVNNNQQAGMVLPLMYDENSKQPVFKFELLKNEGGKAYDTTAIKTYYSNAILTALSADVLILGQGSTGSYALGSIKGSLAAIAIESKCKEICNVINQHLIPIIADLNDWEMTRLPELHMDDLEAVSLEETSKYFQRLASVGFLPRTPEVIDRILEIAGLDSLPENTNLDDVLTASTSKAGQGFKTSGDGLSSGNVESSNNNLENSA